LVTKPTALGNPRYGPFIYGARNGIHIMDLYTDVFQRIKLCKLSVDTRRQRRSIPFSLGTKRHGLLKPIAGRRREMCTNTT